MCQNRILSRVRSRLGGSPENHKRSLLFYVLSKAVHIAQPPNITKHSQGSKTFIERAAAVCGQLDTFSPEGTREDIKAKLCELLQDIYQLTKTTNLPGQVAKIPAHEVLPEVKGKFLNEMEKVASYRAAAKFLCRSAKSCPATRQARVETVGHETSFFRVPVRDGYKPTLRSSLDRLSGQSRRLQVKNLEAYARLKRHSGPSIFC